MNEIAFNVGLVLFGASAGALSMAFALRKLQADYAEFRTLFDREVAFSNRLVLERNELRTFKARHTPYRVNGKFAKKEG